MISSIFNILQHFTYFLLNCSTARRMTQLFQHYPTCHKPFKGTRENASNYYLIARAHKSHRLTTPLEITCTHWFPQCIYNILHGVNFHHLYILYHISNEMVMDIYIYIYYLSLHERLGSYPHEWHYYYHI
jgi:hypothetical protein